MSDQGNDEKGGAEGSDNQNNNRNNGNKPGPKLAQTKVKIGMRIKRWIVVSRIGAGSFGETFTGVEADLDTVPDTGENGVVVSNKALEFIANLPPPGEYDEVCIKVEQENKNVLRLEALALKKVQSCPQVVRYLGSGCTNGMNFLVMEKLGSNLAELRRRSPHGCFNIYTTLKAGISCLTAIRGVHEQGLVHRDIKPSNFVTGLARNGTEATCYIIDFGLARRFRRSNGEIRPARENAGFRGTSRYASVNSHKHLELGRVDDLWSLLFMLVEFATGTLPWRKYKDKDDIGRCKEEAISPHLVRNLPREFQPFIAHLQTLRYEDDPDYDLLLALMERSVERRGYPEGKPVDWELDPSVIAAEALAEEAKQQQQMQAHKAASKANGSAAAQQQQQQQLHPPQPVQPPQIQRIVVESRQDDGTPRPLATPNPRATPKQLSAVGDPLRVSEVEVDYDSPSAQPVRAGAAAVCRPYYNGETQAVTGEEAGHTTKPQDPEMSSAEGSSGDVRVENDPEFSPKEGGHERRRTSTKGSGPKVKQPTFQDTPSDEEGGGRNGMASGPQYVDIDAQLAQANGGIDNNNIDGNDSKPVQKKVKDSKCNCTMM